CVPAFQRSRGIIVKGCHLFSGTLVGSASRCPPRSLHSLHHSFVAHSSTRPSFPQCRSLRSLNVSPSSLNVAVALLAIAQCRYATLHSMPFTTFSTDPRYRSMPLVALTTHPRYATLHSMALSTLRYAHDLAVTHRGPVAHAITIITLDYSDTHLHFFISIRTIFPINSTLSTLATLALLH